MKCSIDSNTREIIFLDNSECFGVEFDKNTQRIEFSCPKIVGDNLDLTKCICRINYMNAKGYRDSYLIDDVLADGDDITFTWKLKGKVTAGRGNCLFIFCARQVNENGVIEKEWNTTVAKASIKRGLETNSHIEEEYSDILESILLKINSVSLTTEVNSESTNENVPTAKAVYDALQDIGIPSGTDISLNVTGATVGQTIKVKAVDMAAGDTWETLAETTLEEESVPILDIGAMASSFSRLRFYFTFPIVESVEKIKVLLAIPNNTTGPAYDVTSINRGNDKSESWAFIDFYPLIYNGICYLSMIESAKVGITNNTTQQFQYNSYDYYRISEARYVRTSKPLPTGATITIMGVRK